MELILASIFIISVYIIIIVTNLWCIAVYIVLALDGAFGQKLEENAVKLERIERKKRLRLIKGGKEDNGAQ